jgi:hypothetical protein
VVVLSFYTKRKQMASFTEMWSNIENVEMRVRRYMKCKEGERRYMDKEERVSRLQTDSVKT